jgi:hypothetical protein
MHSLLDEAGSGRLRQVKSSDVLRADILELDPRRGKRQLRKIGNAAHHAIHRAQPTARNDHLFHAKAARLSLPYIRFTLSFRDVEDLYSSVPMM